MFKVYEFIARKLTNNDAKIILDNFFSLSMLKMVTMLLPLAILPHLAKTINIELIGVLAIVTAIMSYVRTIIDYGFSYSAVRDIAADPANKKRNFNILSQVFFAKIILTFCASFFLVLSYVFVPWLQKNEALVFFSFINIVLLSISPDWFFQGIEKMRLIAIGEVLGKLLSFTLILILVKKNEDFILIPILYSVGQTSTLFVYFFSGRRYVDFSEFRIPSISEIYGILKDGWSVFINILFPNFYNSFSYIAVGYISGPAQVAIYDIARKFISVSEIVITILSRVYFPSVSRNILNHKGYINKSILIGLFLVFFQVVCALVVVGWFFPASYQYAETILLWQALAPLVYALMMGYGVNYLIPIGEDKKLRNITIISSLVGFVLVVIFTYFFGALGAAMGVLMTWSVRAIMSYQVYQETFSLIEINHNKK
jgi:PST family polysaccharide transporter